MPSGVLDAGVALGWLRRTHRASRRIEHLFAASRIGRVDLAISTVNLAEVLIHSAEDARRVGFDPVATLRAYRVTIHAPDEAIARRVARLPASLADGFAAATAQHLKARLHTTDKELAKQLRRTTIAVTLY